MNTQNKIDITKLFRNLLCLIALQGIIAVPFLFQQPSEMDSAVFLGLSMSRLLIVGAFVGIIAILIYLVARAFFRRRWFEVIVKRFDGFLRTEGRSWLFVIVSVFWASLLILLTIALRSSFSIRLNNLRFVLEHVFSLLVWIILTLLEFACILFLYYRKDNRFSFGLIWKTLVIQVVLAGSVVMWLITIFRMEFFTSIPFWVWFYHDMGEYDILFPGVVVGVFAVVYWVLAGDEKTRQKLLVLVLLGFLLQVSFGFIAGKGFVSIQRMAENSAHVRYYERAADNPRLWDALTDYEAYYGWDHFLGTKPPGVISFYIVLQRLSNVINPVSTYAERFSRLIVFLSYVMPLITYLTLIPFFVLSKKFFVGGDVWLPLIFYLVFPNTLLQMLELDISLFALLFVIALLFTHKVIETQGFWWAFAAGAIAYICVFFSFSLLMVIPLSLAWIGVEYIFQWNETSFWHKLKIIGGYILGLFGLGVLFFTVFQYNPVLRYQNALTMHKEMKLLASGFEQLIDAWILNGIEFTMWAGFPIVVLLVMRTIMSGVAIYQKRADAIDRLFAAFLPTFVALNVFGQTRSEVGRLWAFFMPLVSIFIAPEALRLFKRKKVAVFFLLGLQLITAFLIFKFQNALTDI